MGVYAGGSTNG